MTLNFPKTVITVLNLIHWSSFKFFEVLFVYFVTKSSTRKLLYNTLDTLDYASKKV